ncbi:MAG TPA: hypothetical protein VHB21_14435 [Minicystis sp.]|nr:hypothetical protein [Minicystis sp.]
MHSGPTFGPRAIRAAFAVSVALHAVAAAPFVLRRVRPPVREAAPQATVAEPPDRWTGSSPFVGSERLVDIEAPPAAAQPAAAAPPAAAAAEGGGARVKSAAVEVKARGHAAPVHGHVHGNEHAQAPVREPGHGGGKGHGRSGGQDDGAVHPGAFGSEGAAGVRSLGRAFTRAIPPACQGDAAWGEVAPGTSLRAEVTLFVDAAGHVERSQFAERDVPKPIASLLKRTLPLIESNTLSVRAGAIVKGRERLRLVAHVSDATGRPSDELAFPFFANGRGRASFTQPSGRHVDVDVTVVKIEVDSP